MLTLQQLQENDYPLPTYLSGEDNLEEGWVQTAKPNQQTTGGPQPGKKLLAIDCEMVSKKKSLYECDAFLKMALTTTPS